MMWIIRNGNLRKNYTNINYYFLFLKQKYITKIVNFESPGPIEIKIKKKLIENFKPTFLEIKNQSSNHLHHDGVKNFENKLETHFAIKIVSNDFKSKGLLTRHKMVYSLLDEEIKKNKIHALELITESNDE